MMSETRARIGLCTIFMNFYIKNQK